MNHSSSIHLPKALTYASALPYSSGLDLITLHYIATRLASFLIPHGIYPPFNQLAFDLLHLHFPLFLIHRVGSALQLIVSGRKGFRLAILFLLLFYRGPSLSGFPCSHGLSQCTMSKTNYRSLPYVVSFAYLGLASLSRSIANKKYRTQGRSILPSLLPALTSPLLPTFALGRI